MGKVNSITKLEIAIFVFLTMMISGASSIASNDFITLIPQHYYKLNFLST